MNYIMQILKTMLRIQSYPYGNKKSFKYFKWETITVYMDGMLCKQGGNGL